MNQDLCTQDGDATSAITLSGGPSQALESRPRVVLDTNVILALWWFEDPNLGDLREAVVSGHIRWIIASDGEAELLHVMQRRVDVGDDVQRADRVRHWVDLRAVRHAPAPTQLHLRCTDADDQKFIELGLHLGDAVLLSRDRAVLRLRRHAARCGLTILRPEEWSAWHASRQSPRTID
jgi:uncharacterized protein